MNDFFLSFLSQKVTGDYDTHTRFLSLIPAWEKMKTGKSFYRKTRISAIHVLYLFKNIITFACFLIGIDPQPLLP